MCGIAGYYSKGGKFSATELDKMTLALAHRGPDASGVFVNDDRTVGLGHRRLSILDLSEVANQPMVSHDGRYVIAYNGEVYNYMEVAKQLGIRTKTTSDTEVILEAFILKGPEFVHLLNGMFALAIYDKQEDKLFVLRDRMGVKPIYYYYKDGQFAFASETKALLHLPISRELNKTALKDYFFFEYVAQYQSVFKELQKLPQGHYLTLDKNGIQIVKYYDLLDKLQPDVVYPGLDETMQQLDGLLESSVRYRRISDVPVGIFLSGGTDSSLLTSKFQQISDTPIKSFTIGFEVKQFDESGYAEQVARHLKTNHSVSFISEQESKSIVENIVDHFDEPFAAPSTIPSLLVSKKAREHVTVALGGDGGDELFMGYGYYHWYDRIQKLNKLGGRTARKLAVKMLGLMGNRYKRAAQVIDYEDEAGMWPHVWSQEQYMFSENEISSLFGEPYKHTTTLQDWKKIDSLNIHPHRKLSLYDLRQYLPHNLLYKMDIASMASALEVRLPFMDYRLVEYALNMPEKYKIAEGEKKYILKKLLEKYIPKELVYRKKWGFNSPVNHWLRGDLKYMAPKYLGKEIIEKQGLFDYNFVQQTVDKFYKGEDYHYKKVWALIFFQMWYKKYIDDSLWK